MKSKIIYVILLVLIISSNACNENSKLTSNQYKTEINTVLNKIDSLPLNEKRKEFILDSLYNQLIGRENDSVQRNLLIKLADKHYYANRLEKYKSIMERILSLAKNDKDSVLTAKSLYYLGDYYEKKKIGDSALTYYNKADKYYSKLKDSLNIGRVKLYKACVLLDNGIYTQSESEAITALKILSTQNNPRLLHTAYNVIAISLNGLKDFKKSLEYFNLSFKLLKDKKYPKEDLSESKANCFSNIGRVYEKSKNYNQAIIFYKKGLLINHLKIEYPGAYAMIVDNLGYSLIKSGKKQQARSLLFKGLQIRDSLKMPLGIAGSKNNLGEYFIASGDTTTALKYLVDGYRSAKKLKSSDLTLQSLELLMNNDKTNKTYYTQRYIQTKDSIQELERTVKNKFARIEYETDRIEEENQILSKRYTYILVGSSFFILFSIILFIIFRLKSKNKELQLIHEQQQANEQIYLLMLNQQYEKQATRNEERNRIAMELHDGIVNSVFITRYSLDQLITEQPDKKKLLVKELENLEKEIRRVSHDLQQNIQFKDTDLVNLISNLVTSQQNDSNTKFDLTVDKFIDWSSVSGNDKIHIYRIIQEALQNVNKYSKAEKCFVFLLKTADKITLKIWDNGIGFNPEKIKYGIGLKNIQQRTTALNGELKITSTPENGSSIEVVF